MKVDKNFIWSIRLAIFLLLGCMASTTVFAKFAQAKATFRNETNSPITIELLDAANQVLKVPSETWIKMAVAMGYGIPTGATELKLNLTSAMGSKALPLGGTEKIRITVAGYTTFLLGLANEVPELIFRQNNDNGFQTIEIYDGRFRYPITSRCAPLINSKQTLPVAGPIWPSGDVPVVNNTPLPVVITQKDRSGASIGQPVELWIAGSKGTLKIQPTIYYLEINVGYLNIINLYSFKYRDPQLSFGPSGPGVIMQDGTYTYFTMHPNAPIIKAP